MVYRKVDIFDWQSEDEFAHNQYRVRIYWITWEKAVIIATDITENLEGSETANTREIISSICNLHGLVFSKTMFVEHYPSNDLPDKDFYLQVLFTKNEVVRYEIDRDKLIRLIGKQI